MFKKIRLKKIKSVLIKSIPQIIILIVFLILGNILNLLENLKPLDIKDINSLPDNVNRRVEFKADYIVNYYLETYEEEGEKEKTISNGYIGYNYDTDKYFGIEIDVDKSEDFEKALEAYSELDFEKADKIPPTVKGVVYEMDEEEKQFFNESLESVLKEDLVISMFSELTDEEWESFTDGEFNIMYEKLYEEVDKIEIKPEELAEYTDYYYIKYKEDNSYILELAFFSIFIAIFVFVLLYRLIKIIKFSRLIELKDKIYSNYDIREEELEQDFKLALNIDDLWIGNKFTIFSTEDYASFIKNEDIIWIYVEEEETSTKYGKKLCYYMIFIDNKYNQYRVKINKKDVFRALKTYEMKNNNLFIGYNEQLEQLLRTDINKFFSFDREQIHLAVVKKI